MESIGDARAFLSAAREVALSKPIIVIKAGRTDAAARAAASHTGSLIGSDEVLDAAFRRAGVLRVESIAELFSMAEVLSKQPRPGGNRLAIVTNAGGPGVLATDALDCRWRRVGADVAAVKSIARCGAPTPVESWKSDRRAGGRWKRAVRRRREAGGRGSGNDGVLVILTPQAMTDPTQTAEAIAPFAKLEDKPLLASWMGGAEVAGGQAILSQAGIPSFRFPDTAARAFTYMWRYTYNLRGLYETPAVDDDAQRPIDCDAASSLITSRVTPVGNCSTKPNRNSFSPRTVFPSRRCSRQQRPPRPSRPRAASATPSSLKLHSHTITHKTDVGGVKLALAGPEQVQRAFEEIQESITRLAGPEHFAGVSVQPMIDERDGYELIVGSSIDAQFGPVLLVGAGGQLVEVFKDHAIGLPPLNATLARRMMEQTKIYTALQGVRGRRPANLSLLWQILVRFSRLVVEQRWVKELEINPLIVGPDRIVAVDARAVLWSGKSEGDLPRPAIRPYPTQYVSNCKLNDGTSVIIRPIRPEDEPLLVQFHKELSDQSVMFRYFHAINLARRTSHERLIRVCFNDYDRELALVAEGRCANNQRFLLGVGRLSKLPGGKEAEFSILISDAWQSHGLGRQLLTRLLAVARAEKIERLFAMIMGDNREMQRLAEKLGFTLVRSLADSEFHATIDLTMPGPQTTAN